MLVSSVVRPTEKKKNKRVYLVEKGAEKKAPAICGCVDDAGLWRVVFVVAAAVGASRTSVDHQKRRRQPRPHRRRCRTKGVGVRLARSAAGVNTTGQHQRSRPLHQSEF